MPPNDTFMFSPDEQTALAALVGQIIPTSAQFNQPAANDPDILLDILTSGAPLRETLADALATLFDAPQIDADRAATFRQDFPKEAELIQTLTAQCYYRDARVMAALNIDVRPPFPKGYIQDPNDFTLLDPVIQRGEIFRKTP